jgi:hypothetical protein
MCLREKEMQAPPFAGHSPLSSARTTPLLHPLRRRRGRHARSPRRPDCAGIVRVRSLPWPMPSLPRQAPWPPPPPRCTLPQRSPPLLLPFPLFHKKHTDLQPTLSHTQLQLRAAGGPSRLPPPPPFAPAAINACQSYLTTSRAPPIHWRMIAKGPLSDGVALLSAISPSAAVASQMHCLLRVEGRKYTAVAQYLHSKPT